MTKKNREGRLPSLSIGKFIGQFFGFWLLYYIVYSIMTDEEDLNYFLSSVLAGLALITPAIALLFKQVNTASSLSEKIDALFNNLTVTSDHLRKLNRDLKGDVQNRDNLLSQIHRYEDRLLQEKLDYNQAVKDYNSLINSLPLSFAKSIFKLHIKDYHNDFYL